MIGNGLIELNRYEEALEYFTRALKLASRTKDIGFPFMAYEGESRCLVALNRFQEADKLLRAGLEASQKLQRRGHEAQILVLLGKLSLATNNVTQATSYLRAANDLSRSAQFYPTEVEATFQLAAIYRAQGKVWETEQCLQLGIAASRALGDKYYLPRDLSSLAEIEMSRGRFRNADALWEQATDVLEGMLINAPSPDARSTMIAAMSDVYLRHFLLAVRKHEVEKAFQIVERVRGRSIVDLLWHRSLDRSRLNVDMNAAQHISTLQIQLMHAVSRNQRQGLLDQLFDAEQKWSFQESDQAQHYRVQRPIALRTLQRFLRKDEVLLEYVLADPRSYCVVVTRRHARLVSIGASREQIGVLVGEYLEEVKERRSANEAAQRLYSLLLDPISAVALRPRMVVVPDGVLHLLPFDALRVPNGNYLLQSSVVTYVPSATVLYFLRTSRKGTVPSLPFLGIGDVVYNADQRKELADSGGARQSRGRGLYDLVGATFRALPGTRDEVLAASQIFGPRSVVLLGAGATETAFKSQPLAKFGILHLAVHGIFSPKYPERSALVLGRDGNTGEDGLLQTREITNLVLNADLVTLSACDTGAGRLQGEEGIASLQRAFLFAGAKSTLAMLWNADDIFTAALIKQFYRNLAAGMDKGSALREAKMNLLATFGDRALPFYWAGAVLIGESSRPLLFLK